MKSVIFLIVTMLLLFACMSPSEGAPTLTATPFLAASAEQTKTTTLAPSATLISDTLTPDTSTPTITPLPTIPTFTPTFDVRTIVTAAPAPKAECPKEDSNFMNSMGLESYPIQSLNLLPTPILYWSI